VSLVAPQATAITRGEPGEPGEAVFPAADGDVSASAVASAPRGVTQDLNSLTTRRCMAGVLSSGGKEVRTEQQSIIGTRSRPGFWSESTLMPDVEFFCRLCHAVNVVPAEPVGKIVCRNCGLSIPVPKSSPSQTPAAKPEPAPLMPQAGGSTALLKRLDFLKDTLAQATAVPPAPTTPPPVPVPEPPPMRHWAQRAGLLSGVAALGGGITLAVLGVVFTFSDSGMIYYGLVWVGSDLGLTGLYCLLNDEPYWSVPKPVHFATALVGAFVAVMFLVFMR
jgi:hypothetical protein